MPPQRSPGSRVGQGRPPIGAGSSAYCCAARRSSGRSRGPHPGPSELHLRMGGASAAGQELQDPVNRLFVMKRGRARSTRRSAWA